MKSWKKLALVAGLLALIIAGYQSGLSQYLSLESIKSQQSQISVYYAENPVTLVTAFFAFYVLSTALMFPGGALLTLLAGALFGLAWGTVIVSFASTIGATLAFLIARYALGNSIQEKWGEQLKKINEGVAREGGFYLFTLRLVPAVPFFLVNLLMGFTKIRTSTYYWVSQVGMLPGTAVYVNAGTELAKLESLEGILSPSLIFSFVILAIFPMITKKSLEFFKTKKQKVA